METQQAPVYTDAQLHERACIACGQPGDLVPAGHVEVEVREGETLAWAVAAHPEHQGTRS